MINAEVEQVREVIRRYMDAGRKGDRDTLLSCFHRDARVSVIWATGCSPACRRS